MNHIRWTPAAFADLKRISGHIEGQRSLAAATRVCRILYDTVQILRRFPASGRLGVESGTRELVVAEIPSYIIVYRTIDPDTVEILRIWHGAQQR